MEEIQETEERRESISRWLDENHQENRERIIIIFFSFSHKIVPA
jgi:hypothetical protein